MSAANDLFTPSLAAVQTLSADLNTALGDNAADWTLMTGTTFVAAFRDEGRRVVTGNCGGWRSMQVPERGAPHVSEAFVTAAEAVAALCAAAPLKPAPKPTPSRKKPS